MIAFLASVLREGVRSGRWAKRGPDASGNAAAGAAVLGSRSERHRVFSPDFVERRQIVGITVFFAE
jgi:hypothetical protein